MDNVFIEGGSGLLELLVLVLVWVFLFGYGSSLGGKGDADRQ